RYPMRPGRRRGLLVVDSNALTAIGTLAVAVVAVIPIVLDYSRRKQQAQALRSHLEVRLSDARLIFAYPELRQRNSQNPRAPKILRPDAPLTHWESEPIAAIEALMPQAYLLLPREFRAVSATFLLLSTARRMWELDKELADYAVKMIDVTLRELAKGEPPG